MTRISRQELERTNPAPGRVTPVVKPSLISRRGIRKELTLHTHSAGEMNDLTNAVTRIVSESGVRTGIVQIFNVGSTAAIGAIEFESGLKALRPDLGDDDPFQDAAEAIGWVGIN